MRRALLAVVALLAACAAPVQASTADSTPAASAPRVEASAWYLVGDDGAVLAAHRARQRRAMASITKLMTAVVTLERSSPGDVVVVDPRAARTGGSTAFLRAGEQLTVAELLRAMLVASANDTAAALGLHVGGGSMPRFIAFMNGKARELGLTDTTFRNPHGLDAPGHRSSARDATMLVRYALGVSFVRDALDRRSVSLPGRTLDATDDLGGSWPRLVGGKTGHTRDAGWSQAAGAGRQGVTVYGTVLGSESRGQRNEALRELLQYGLDRYRRVAAVDAGRVYATATTGYGAPDVQLVAQGTIVETVPADVPLVERIVAPAAVALPVREGETLGRVEVWVEGRLLAATNLVAAASVSEPGFLAKVGWFLGALVDNLQELVS